LKDILLKTEGLEQEGIFRKAGVESEMIVLQDKIAAGECFHCSNPHNIGTLLKVFLSYTFFLLVKNLL